MFHVQSWQRLQTGWSTSWIQLSELLDSALEDYRVTGNQESDMIIDSVGSPNDY